MADNRVIIDGVGHKYANRPADADWGVVALKKETSRNKALGQVKAFGDKSFPVTGVRDPAVGMTVCKHGTTTQTTCGEVTAVGVRIALNGEIVDDLIQTSVCVRHGDSGGPLFTDSTPNATTVEGVGLNDSTFLYDEEDPQGACGEEVGEPNISWFVPLSLALTQANAQTPRNDISLRTR